MPYLALMTGIDSGKMTDINPIPFLWKNQATTIKGWEIIHEHLERVLEKCEIGEGCDDGDKNYTIIQFESLTIKIEGQITVDHTLTILSMWEVSFICSVLSVLDIT